MSTGVGADIKAKCNKCKLNTWHVIVAMVGTRIAKVQCKSCSAQHRYKDPNGAAAPSKRGVSKRNATPAKPSGPMVEANLRNPIRSYSVREQFAVGDRVDHIKFGVGVVEELPDAGKMTVCFPDMRRVLAMAKPEAKLMRPTTRFD